LSPSSFAEGAVNSDVQATRDETLLYRVDHDEGRTSENGCGGDGLACESNRCYVSYSM
jgi:hypothetical protein